MKIQGGARSPLLTPMVKNKVLWETWEKELWETKYFGKQSSLGNKVLWETIKLF